MTNPTTHADLEVAHELVIRDFRLMESWNDSEASALIAPTMANDEAMAEPPAARAPGVAGARATYDWLHAAYEDLHWTIHKIVAEGDWVVAHTTMSGRQVGPFVTYTPDGEVEGSSRRPGETSPRPRRTGSASPTVDSSNTRPTGTT